MARPRRDRGQDESETAADEATQQKSHLVTLAKELDVAPQRVGDWLQDWRASGGRAKAFARNCGYCLGAAVVVSFIAAVLRYYWLRLEVEQECRYYDYDQPLKECLADERAESIQSAIQVAAISGAIAVIAGLILAFYLTRLSGVTFVRAAAISEKKRELGRLESTLFEDELRLPALWSAVNQRLDLYHSIATSQANASFRRAQIAMLSAFSLLIFCALLSILVRDNAAAITLGAVGALSTALGGYVSRTFLRAQEGASSQLQAYFDQPLEFSRYLMAERLLERDDMSAQDVSRGVLLLVAGVAGQSLPNETAETSTATD